MSHFYGTLQGNRGEATRCGTKGSGITTHAAGWQGAIRADVFRVNGADRYRVQLVPWQGSGGCSRVLAEGELSTTAEQPQSITYEEIRDAADKFLDTYPDYALAISILLGDVRARCK